MWAKHISSLNFFVEELFFARKHLKWKRVVFFLIASNENICKDFRSTLFFKMMVMKPFFLKSSPIVHPNQHFSKKFEYVLSERNRKNNSFFSQLESYLDRIAFVAFYRDLKKNCNEYNFVELGRSLISNFICGSLKKQVPFAFTSILSCLYIKHVVDLVAKRMWNWMITRDHCF